MCFFVRGFLWSLLLNVRGLLAGMYICLFFSILPFLFLYFPLCSNISIISNVVMGLSLVSAVSFVGFLVPVLVSHRCSKPHSVLEPSSNLISKMSCTPCSCMAVTVCVFPLGLSIFVPTCNAPIVVYPYGVRTLAEYGCIFPPPLFPPMIRKSACVVSTCSWKPFCGMMSYIFSPMGWCRFWSRSFSMCW